MTICSCSRLLRVHKHLKGFFSAYIIVPTNERMLYSICSILSMFYFFILRLDTQFPEREQEGDLDENREPAPASYSILVRPETSEVSEESAVEPDYHKEPDNGLLLIHLQYIHAVH